MASLSEILNDPNYVNANEETKAAIFTKYAPQDENYTQANAATQAAIRNRFGVEGQPGIGARSDLDTSLYSGYQGVKGGLAGLAGRLGIMDIEKAKQIQEEAEEKGKKAFKPIEGGWGTDFSGKFVETLGQSIPYMIAPIAAAGVATVAGAPGAVATGISGLASAIQFAGSNLQRQQEQGVALEDTNIAGAIATAIPQAALETLSFRMIPGVQRLFGKAGKEITEAQAAEIAKQGIVRSTAAYGAQGARTGGIEGMTEVGQQFLERLQAGLDVGNQDAINEFVESFIGGAVLGGTLAIPGTAMRRDQARQMAAQAPVAPETVETAPEVTPPATPEQIVVPESESQRTDVMMAELEGRPLPIEEAVAEPAPSTTEVVEPVDQSQPPQRTEPSAEDIVRLDEKGEPIEEKTEEVLDPNIQAQLAAEEPDVESMTPNYPPPPKVEKAPRVKREPTPPRVMYGVDSDGNLNVPVSEGGVAFASKKDAVAAKKLSPGLILAKSKGQYFLAEKTAKEIAADKIKAARLQAGPQGILSAHEFIASLGGLDKKEASELNPDFAQSNIKIGNKYLYKGKGGLTAAEAAERLKEAEYITDEDNTSVYKIISESLESPVYSMRDADAIAEQRFAERDAELAEQAQKKESEDLTEAADVGRENAEFRDYLVLERELGDPVASMIEAGYTPAELQEAGFMDASIDLQTEVAALQDLATPENIDALDIINSLDTKGQAAEEKVNAEEQAIAREIAQAAKSGGRANAGEVDEAKGVAQTVDTDAFKRWSNNAPLVEAKDALLYDFQTGQPFVAQSYHGTNSPEDFTEFSLEALGTQTAAESADMGFFSTSESEVAGSYASNIGFGRWLSLAFKGSPDLKNDPQAIRLQAALDDANKTASKVAYDAVDEVIPYLKDVGKGNPELQRKLAATMMEVAPGAEERMARINAAREKADNAAKALSNYVIDSEASKVPQRIMPIFVKMSNPKVYDAKGKTPADFPLSEKIEQAKKEGYDGVVFKNIADPAPVAVHYVTFKPNQIKSTFNRGTFDETENISEARGAGSQNRTEFLANSFGKENVVYQDGDLALVLANNMFNDPVYLPVKGTKYLKIDLTKDKKPDLLTTPEFDRLIAEKERIEREAQAKHKSNPFIKFKDGLAVSESISSLSPELADVFAGWKKMLRLNGNIYLTTIEDALANSGRFTGPHRRVGVSAKKFAKEKLSGVTQKMGDDRYIIIDSDVSPAQMLEILAHEMGHAHQQEAFYGAPKDVRDKVQRAYEEWLKKQKGATAQELINALRPFRMARATKLDTPSFQAKAVLSNYDSYWTSFNEWYADNTARWATTSAKPLSVVDRFFAKVAQTLRSFYDAIKAGGFLPNETFKEYMDAITDKEAVAANPIAPDDAKGQLPLFAKQAAQIPQPSIVTTKNVKPWDSPDLTWKDSFIRKIADRNVDLKVVQNEISKQIGNLRDNVNAYQIEDQSHGRIQSQTADFLDYEFRPILKEMIANNVSDAELTKYLWMRHAPEANKVIAERNINNPDKQDGGSGVETDVAKRYMATLPADKKKKLESLAKQVDNILALTREQLEKNGIISKEEREAWESMFEHYVPLKREESDYALPTSTYRGVGPFSKSRTGSTSKNVIDILANVAINREIAIIRIEKERIKRAIYGLAVTNPNAGFWKAVSPDAIKNKQQLENELVNMGISAQDVKNIFAEPKTEYFNKTTGQVESRVDQQKRYADYVLPVKIDGKDRFIFFNPKDERAMMMVTALKGLDTKPLSDFAAAMAPITRWFASVNTQYNLIFGLWNFARDLQGAVFNLTTTPLADKKSEVIKGALSALPELYKEARTRRKGGVPASLADGSVQDFVAQGGKIGGRERFAEYDKSAQLVENELSKLNRGNVKKAAYATLDWISNVNDMLENAVRLSAYRSGLKAGMSKQQAADIAKNITVNFNRKGTVANNVGALYAFFNASVQGTARLAQTVDPRTKRGQKIMASLVGLGVVQAVALAMAGFDEDEPSEFLKQKNLIIPLGDKKYFMWPMPFGLNVFPNIGRLLFEGSSQAIRGKGVKDTVANMGSMLLNSFNPIGGGGVLQGLSPTSIDPIVAIYQNRDAFDRPIAKEDQRSAPTPGFTRSRDPSASISQFISQLLNTASGGTNYSKGLVSPTADQINYLAEQVGGGVYREASRIVRYTGEKIRGDETPEYRVPIVGKLVGSTESPAAISQKFYNNVVKMSEHEDEIKGRIKDRQSSSQYLRDNPEATLWRRANTLENELTKINKQRKELIARDAPKEQLKRLDDQKTRMMKQFNDDVKKREAAR